MPDRDPLYAEARRYIVTSGFGSTAALQRKIRCGFAKAAKLMDDLHLAGIVGPIDGARDRAVLMTPAELHVLETQEAEATRA